MSGVDRETRSEAGHKKQDETMEDQAVAVSREELDAERLARLRNIKEEANAPCSKTFRKRKPRPGHYPAFYSPFRLDVGPSSVIPISRWDLKEDLLALKAGYSAEYSSTYFDEEGAPTAGKTAASGQAAPKTVAPVVTVSDCRPAKARRKSSKIEPPHSRAEEERQLRAALKASQLTAPMEPSPAVKARAVRPNFVLGSVPDGVLCAPRGICGVA